jgi:hypothetical protein
MHRQILDSDPKWFGRLWAAPAPFLRRQIENAALHNELLEPGSAVTHEVWEAIPQVRGAPKKVPFDLIATDCLLDAYCDHWLADVRRRKIPFSYVFWD